MVATVFLYGIVQVLVGIPGAFSIVTRRKPLHSACQLKRILRYFDSVLHVLGGGWCAVLLGSLGSLRCSCGSEQIPAFLGHKQGPASLAGAIVCVIILAAYCIFQVRILQCKHLGDCFRIMPCIGSRTLSRRTPSTQGLYHSGVLNRGFEQRAQAAVTMAT